MIAELARPTLLLTCLSVALLAPPPRDALVIAWRDRPLVVEVVDQRPCTWCMSSVRRIEIARPPRVLYVAW